MLNLVCEAQSAVNVAKNSNMNKQAGEREVGEGIRAQISVKR